MAKCVPENSGTVSRDNLTKFVQSFTEIPSKGVQKQYNYNEALQRSCFSDKYVQMSGCCKLQFSAADGSQHTCLQTVFIVTSSRLAVFNIFFTTLFSMSS